MAAQARRLELRAGREAGELVERRVVELSWSRHIVEARNKLLSIPSRLKQRRPDLSREDLAALDGLIRECLDELANTVPNENTKGAVTCPIPFAQS